MAPVKQSPTSFQERVYAALRRVPRGRVTTYKILARWIRCGSYRAVGQALRRNPYAPRVPCHRVIASDLTIGGFSAFGETSSKDGQGHKTGKPIRKKLKLLRSEGVVFRRGKLTNLALIYEFIKALSGHN